MGTGQERERAVEILLNAKTYYRKLRFLFRWDGYGASSLEDTEEEHANLIPGGNKAT